MRTKCSECVVLLLILLSGGSSAQEIASTRRANIEKVLEITNARSKGESAMRALLDQQYKSFQEANPDIPPRMVEAAKEETLAMFSEHAAEIDDLMIDAFGKYFTDQDIQVLVDFYSSDTGRKFVALSPRAIDEATAAGAKFGDSLIPELQR